MKYEIIKFSIVLTRHSALSCSICFYDLLCSSTAIKYTTQLCRLALQLIQLSMLIAIWQLSRLRFKLRFPLDCKSVQVVSQSMYVCVREGVYVCATRLPFALAIV